MAFPTPQPSPVIDEPLRPRALWYWIGGLVILGGIIGAIVGFVLGFSGLDDTIDGFERVPYPEGGVVTIDEPGKYVIYGEQPSSFTDANVNAVINLIDPDGDTVVTSYYSGELNYDFSGRSGAAIATFTADTAGSYRLQPDEDGVGNAESLAIGESIAGELVRVILVPMLIGGLGFIGGAVILIVTGVRRSRAKRRRQPPAPPPGAWGQAPSTWGAQPEAPAPPQAQWGQPSAGAPPPPPPPPSGGTPPPPPGWPT